MLNQQNNLKSEAAKAIELIKIAYELVASHGTKGMPSGHLYAAMMSAFSDVNAYESMIGMMVRTKLLSKSGHLLIAAKV